MARIEQYIEKSNLGLRIKKRDLDAFHELYKTSFLPLQHYAMRYLYDWNKRKTWYRMLFCLCGITWKDMMKNNLYFIICSVLSGIIA